MFGVFSTKVFVFCEVHEQMLIVLIYYYISIRVYPSSQSLSHDRNFFTFINQLQYNTMFIEYV